MGRFQSEQEARDAGVYVAKIKSFVKREGRLTKGQAKALETHWSSMGLELNNGKLNLDKVFGRKAPRILEIGFGMGKSLVEMATASPEQDFIGIEVHKPGVGACLAEAGKNNLANLRVFEHDAVEVLQQCIPDSSIRRLQIYFPDPWHKKRHLKRRLVQANFIELIKGKLEIGGHLHMATDWEPYAQHMLEVMQHFSSFENLSPSADFIARPDYRPMTKFEHRGQKLGHGVWDILFQRVD